MAQYSIPYGRSELRFKIGEDRKVDIITPHEIPAASDPQYNVEQALDLPIGEKCLEKFSGVKSAAIAINDKTRLVPHDILLPALLQRLESLGIPPSKIQFFIANGMHPPMGRGEFPSILSQKILDRYMVHSHDARNNDFLVHLGDTSQGTPVWVNQLFSRADLRVVVGSISPHQFQGFSGGVKGAAIGLAGEATINANHSLMSHPNSILGEYESNPARQDVEEIGEIIGIHFVLNAVLNQRKEIVQVLAGNPRQVMQKGILLARQICQVQVPSNYSFLIVSPGGHPKDINLYQAQKALHHACQVASPGATVILTAACPEGIGSTSYEEWMKNVFSYEEVFERFAREGFRVGPHKAYLIARDASAIKLRFLSNMPPDLVRSLLLEPVSDLQAALDEGLKDLPTSEAIGIVPHAASTIPYLL